MKHSRILPALFVAPAIPLFLACGCTLPGLWGPGAALSHTPAAKPVAGSPSPTAEAIGGGGAAAASPTPTPALGSVLIPAGTFTMGSPADEPGRYNDEVPHQVTLTRGFYLQTTEVTQGQWKALMGNNPSFFKNAGDAAPVEQVNWWEAAHYANALSASESLSACYTFAGCTGTAGVDLDCGKGTTAVTTADGNPYQCTGYRLPTEAEWEYAYRAGTPTAFYNGQISRTGSDPVDPKLDLIGWFWGNSDVNYEGGYSGEKRSRGPHAFGGKQGNAWGLYDMAGNVLEWVWDWSGAYSSGSVTDPQGPRSGLRRVGRGGSWNSDSEIARAAYRNDDYPVYRLGNLGFRLARSKP